MRFAAAAAAASAVFSLLLPAHAGGDVKVVGFECGADVTDANFSFRTEIPASEAKGIVVLVPGYNGDGGKMLDDAAWVAFARRNGFILGAFTFVSPVGLLKDGRGYYDTGSGSGDAASAVLRRIGGKLPVFMYGFSGGAHFTANFAESHPRSLAGWCAASFDDKRRSVFAKKATGERRAHGIVACGGADGRVGVAMDYYGRGRAAGRQWTWLELPGLGHERSSVIEAFARRYFLALMRSKTPGIWLDIGSREDVAHSGSAAQELRTWLPDEETARAWREISSQKEHGIVQRIVKVKNLDGYEKLTMFLRMPRSGRVNGVLCLCLLADNPTAVREQIRGDGEVKRPAIEFAESRGLAVVAWGARRLWDANLNWSELSRARSKEVDRDFDCAATAWQSGIEYFVRTYGIPESGYLMSGFSGSAQYAMRLAMRQPKRFAAVHLHIPSSFDRPDKYASRILWCLTTGENEMGYMRSLEFFRRARQLGYPIVYKAYPGLGHSDSPLAVKLGFACFEYALGAVAGGVDVRDRFAAAPYVADVVHQRCYGKDDIDLVPEEMRMAIPDRDIRDIWELE